MSCTNWLARVSVMPKEEVLDPQGVAILGALRHLGFGGVAAVRSGRVFDLHITNCDHAEAERLAADAAARLLANTVVETYRVSVEPWGVAQKGAAMEQAEQGAAL